MTGLKTWVISKGGDGLTMDEIEDNLFYEGLYNNPLNWFKFAKTNGDGTKTHYSNEIDKSFSFNVNECYTSNTEIPTNGNVQIYVAFTTTSESYPLFSKFHIITSRGTTGKLYLPTISNTETKWYKYNKIVEPPLNNYGLFLFYINDNEDSISNFSRMDKYNTAKYCIKTYSFDSKYHDKILECLFGKLDSSLVKIECVITNNPTFEINAETYEESETITNKNINNNIKYEETELMDRLKQVIKLLSQ